MADVVPHRVDSEASVILNWTTCVCGRAMHWEDCWKGCDEGYFDAYDEDPINESPGTMEPCEECRGKGGFWICDSVRTEDAH